MRGGGGSSSSLWGVETLYCKSLAVEELSVGGRLAEKRLDRLELRGGVMLLASFGGGRELADLRGEALGLRALSGRRRFERVPFAYDSLPVARERRPSTPVLHRLGCLKSEEGLSILVMRLWSRGGIRVS